MQGKTRTGLGGIGFIVVLLTLGMMAFASSASAAPCTTNILCNGSNQPLRDDNVGNAGAETTNYGADGLASNTEGKLRLSATVPATEPPQKVSNENDANYAYFGVELENNPATSEAECRSATGHVTFADVQNATPSAVYAGISPGGFGPWPITVVSNDPVCGGFAGLVVASNVHLLFPGLGDTTAVGNFLGTYRQPSEVAGECEAGGMELAIAQPQVTVTIGGKGGTVLEKPEIDNGNNNQNAFLCFVSANNDLFPSVAPVWSDEENPLEGAIWKD